MTMRILYLEEPGSTGEKVRTFLAQACTQEAAASSQPSSKQPPQLEVISDRGQAAGEISARAVDLAVIVATTDFNLPSTISPPTNSGPAVPIIAVTTDAQKAHLLSNPTSEIMDIVSTSELERLALILPHAFESVALRRSQAELEKQVAQAKALLLQNQKSITIGRLLGSIAHEINNPLEAIANLLYLSERNPRKPSFVNKCIRMAEEELHRVSEITKQMLTFHRDSKEAQEVVAIDAIENILSLHAARLRRAQVQVVRKYHCNGTLFAHPGELRQVFSNLVSNALDAMPSGGLLVLRVRQLKASRNMLCITIADTGSGMPDHVRERLGELFFTTKGESGTGIGLWVTHQLVAKYGGSVRVRSSVRPGRSGTHFRLCFPEPHARFDEQHPFDQHHRAKWSISNPDQQAMDRSGNHNHPKRA